MALFRSGLVLGLAVVLAWPVVAQDMPKPTKEHGYFKQLVGNWDGEMKMGGPMPQTSKVTIKAHMLGDLWLVSAHEGNIGGMPFKGQEVAGYDPAKKKTVSTWVDNLMPAMFHAEGQWDKDGKKLTNVMEGPTMSGKPGKWKAVTEFKDKDTFTFSMTPEPGTEDPMAFIATYKRVK